LRVHTDRPKTGIRTSAIDDIFRNNQSLARSSRSG
jgi:hypothetical protein